MKIFTQKSLVLVLGCIAGTAVAAGQDFLPEGFALPEEISTESRNVVPMTQERSVKTDAFSDQQATDFLKCIYAIKPATAAQIAAETGINLDGGMLSRDFSTALFPSVDVEMIRNYAALAKNDLVAFNSGEMNRFLKKWGARVGLGALLGVLLYRNWFAGSNSASSVVTPQAGSQGQSDQDCIRIIADSVRAQNALKDKEANKWWYQKLGDNIQDGVGTLLKFTVIPGALYVGGTQAFASDPKSPLAHYFISGLSTQAANLSSSVNEYSTIVGTAAADKTQSDENFMSIVSRAHAQFVNSVEAYCGYLVALRSHFEQQQVVVSAQVEKMKAQKNVDEITQAEKRCALKAAKVITDTIDSALIQVYPLVNQFTAALTKAKKRVVLANAVQNNLGLLCNTNQQYQEGILIVYGKQLENALYNFYGLEKPKAPDMAAMMASMGGMLGGM